MQHGQRFFRTQSWKHAVLVTVAVILALSTLLPYQVTSAAEQATAPFLVANAQPSGQADGQVMSAAQQLADRYAPVIYLRQVNNNICDQENEGFDPVPVDFVLGREEIPFMVSENGQTSGTRSIVAESPDASDLYGMGSGSYLDYPGSPVLPRCTYRQYHANRLATEDVPRVAYAHIYQEPGTDELALQYWMYYYFNDWNNDHEGDWEMIMLFFDASSAEEALAQEPTRVVYAQHGGGERTDWDDDILSKEDGRPVVYSARGAHASFYEQHVYLGLAENGTGFGCETTQGPHRRYELDAIVVPHEPTGPDDPFAWLAFTGRWGEFRRSEWNGPTGPNDKTSWTEPVSWGDRQRDSSLIVPTFEGFGQSPIKLFCGIVSGGSRILVAFTRTPALMTGIFAAVIAIISWTLSYSSHSIRAAYTYFRRYLRTFAIIGALLIPGGYIVATLQTLLFHVPPIEPFISIMQRFPGVRIFLALVIGSVQAALAVIFVAPTVIWTMAQLREGRQPGIIEAYRHGVRFIVPIFKARLHAAIRIVRSAITIVGFPRAIQQIIRAIFIPQAVIVGHHNPNEAVQESEQTADVNLTRTFLTQVILTLIVTLTPPLAAIFLLLAIPSRPLGLINFISSVLFAFLYPLNVVGMTLLFHSLRSDGQSVRSSDQPSMRAQPGIDRTQSLPEFEA